MSSTIRGFGAADGLSTSSNNASSNSSSYQRKQSTKVDEKKSGSSILTRHAIEVAKLSGSNSASSDGSERLRRAGNANRVPLRGILRPADPELREAEQQLRAAEQRNAALRRAHRECSAAVSALRSRGEDLETELAVLEQQISDTARERDESWEFRMVELMVKIQLLRRSD